MHDRSKPLASLLLLALLAASPIVAAEEKPEHRDVEIQLITMGEADDLYTAGGHAALMVVDLKDGQPDPTHTLVYNYGDSDWDDPWLVPNFFRGTLVFFLSSSGALSDTIREYGIRQGRETWRQKINLTAAQAREVARRLELEILPANRRYRYHHYKAICTTRIRDLLDEVLGGELKRQLSGPSGYTVRDLQRETFQAHPFAAIGADLFLGRLHDQPLNRYDSMFVPWVLASDLAQVQVPGAGGAGATQPLVEPRIVLTEFAAGSRPRTKSEATLVASLAALLAILLGGVAAHRRFPERPRAAGVLVATGALLFGLIGLAMTSLLAFSLSPELRTNENLICFPLFDLFLLPMAVRWIRGQSAAGTIARGYALVRVLLPLCALALHAGGLFYQQPLILCFVSLGFGALLFTLVRRASDSSRSLTAIAPAITC